MGCIVGLAFFLSGAAALVYQVAWQRILALHSGVGIYSVALIVAAFLAGLGLGSHLGGTWSARISPATALRTFAAVEIGIGVFGAASPWLYYDWLYARVGWLYTPAWRAGVLHLAGLLVPTTLMGMSLPFLVRGRVLDVPSAGRVIGVLYAINLLGAATGAALTPWVLVRAWGLRGTLLAAAAANVAAGLLALFVSREGVSEPARSTAADGPSEPGRGLGFWAFLYALGGFCALSLEIAWFRLLDVALKATAYTFGTLLAVYLLGMAAGTLAGTRLLHRIRHPLAAYLLAQAALLAWAGLALVALVHLSPETAGLRGLYEYWSAPRPFNLGASGDAGRPPPPVRPVPGAPVRAAHRAHGVLVRAAPARGARRPPDERAQGGAAPGRQHRGVRGGLAPHGPRPAGPPRPFRHVPAGAVPGPRVRGHRTRGDRGRPPRGVRRRRRRAAGRWSWPFPGRGPLAARPRHRRRRLHGGRRRHGHGRTDPRGSALEPVGRTAARNSSLPFGGMHTLLGAVPAVLHASPAEVAVIGLGSGDTAWAAACRRETRRVTVFELLAPQRRLLPGWPRRLPGRTGLREFLADPRIDHRVADGRNALALEDARYDVIEMDALFPSSPYSGNLYSVEFYELCARRLRPGGLMCSWSPRPRVAASFRRAFPHVIEMRDASILVGSNDPLPVDWRPGWRAPARADVAGYLGENNVRKLVACLETARPAPAGAGPEGEVNRDLFPRDEFKTREEEPPPAPRPRPGARSGRPGSRPPPPPRGAGWASRAASGSRPAGPACGPRGGRTR